MNCVLYKNTLCINNRKDDNDCVDYNCSDCLIHVSVEHDKLLKERKLWE